MRQNHNLDQKRGFLPLVAGAVVITLSTVGMYSVRAWKAMEEERKNNPGLYDDDGEEEEHGGEFHSAPATDNLYLGLDIGSSYSKVSFFDAANSRNVPSVLENHEGSRMSASAIFQVRSRWRGART
jgi:hypothetical protein